MLEGFKGNVEHNYLGLIARDLKGRPLMKKFIAPVLLVAATAITACQPLSPQDRSNLGLVGGAGAGLLLHGLSQARGWLHPAGGYRREPVIRALIVSGML